MLDVCLCFGCGGVDGVGGEWVRGFGPGSGGVGWCYICVSCESGFSVYMAGPHDRFSPQKRKSGPHFLGREGSTQFAQQSATAVTATPFVGCVVWSL